MMGMMTTNEIRAYYQGQEDALKFNSRPGDINQTLFKAESADWKLLVGYDDVELGVYLEVTFKNRVDAEGVTKTVTMPMRSMKAAMERATTFMTNHTPDEPYCDVDY
jgi:uncharacterized lipoprotein NlpE involved in copper resistance